MTIGEIKSEALRISFPDPQLYIDSSDDEAVSAALSSLKEDPGYSDFLAASVGSVNRALSFIERRGLSPLASRAVSSVFDEEIGLYIIDVSAFMCEMLFTEGIYRANEGIYESVPFEDLGNGKIMPGGEGGKARYLIKYRTILERIGSLTPENTELPLHDSLASLIPYFIKGELLSSEDPEASAEAMGRFEKECASLPLQYAEHTSVLSVYRQEEIS